MYLIETVPGAFEMSNVMNEYIEKLHLEGIGGPFFQTQLNATDGLSSCPHLTHLCVSNLNINENTLTGLSEAVKSGWLPQLSHLSFIECGSTLKGKLGTLFKSQWSQLMKLVISRCEMDLSDVNVLSKDFLPKLTAMTLFLGAISQTTQDENTNRRLTIVKLHEKFKQESIKKLFFPTLTRIGLQEIDIKMFREVIKILSTPNKLTLTELSLSIALNDTEQKVLASLTPLNFTSLTSLTLVRFIRSHGQTDFLTRCPVLFQLEKLDLSESSGLTGEVCNLLAHSFSKLNTLTLSNCKLIADDLCSLAKANAENRLPELRKLDISHNGIACR